MACGRSSSITRFTEVAKRDHGRAVVPLERPHGVAEARAWRRLGSRIATRVRQCEDESSDLRLRAPL
jgi:hypothetical protein